MKKAKKYEIDSLEKLVNVATRKNLGSLTMDLVMWLSYVVQFMEDLRENHPKLCKGKSNWELCRMTFIWIDDGKNDMKSIVLKNQLTGEVKEFELKTK